MTTSEQQARADAAREFIASALSALPDDGIAAMAVPTTAAPLDVVLAAVTSDVQSLWRSATGPSMAGTGQAAVVSATGPDRCAALKAETSKLFTSIARIQTSAHGARARPRLLGGLSFAPGATREHPWESFGDASFVLHRWLYERDGDQATLLLVVDPADPAAPKPQQILDEYDALVAALEAHAAAGLMTETTVPASPIPARDMDQMELPDWVDYVRAIQKELEAGRFEKLVASRRAVIEIPEQVDAAAAVARLALMYPHTTAFLFRRGAAAFVGATPETFFTKTGRTVTSHGLAGSLFAGADEAEQARQTRVLSRSKKNQGEHAVVVREIVRGLQQHCTEITHDPKPNVIRVRGLLHLSTAIKGELNAETTPFDIVETLHPTPAVGGVPREASVDWITANERLERGWFTGPIGWIDSEDDAEFKVAIRCGVIEPGTATIYTGAGIVAKSKPAAEYHETSLKQQPLLRAIGATT